MISNKPNGNREPGNPTLKPQPLTDASAQVKNWMEHPIRKRFRGIKGEAAAATCPTLGQVACQRKLDIVRQAGAHMAACLELHSCPTVADICAAIDVSERTLQYSFRDLLQVTPVAYMRMLRLKRARAALLRPGSPTITITRVATRYGFFHLGKFARDYFGQFGEKPSETLARALECAG